MDQQHLLRLVSELTGSILPTNEQSDREIESLQLSVIESLMNQNESPGSPPLKFENLDEFSTETLAETAKDRLHQLISNAALSVESSGDGNAFYKVYRREYPIISSQLQGSTPSWGRGALIERTLGPFILSTGRRIWFDFFRTVKLIPVFIGSESTPSLLIPLRPAIRIINRAYTVQPGTTWIRSNRICNGLATNLYTGFIIKGGSLEFSENAPIVADKIHAAAAVSIALSLDLIQPVINDISPDDHGIDAKNSKLNLPTHFKLLISSGSSNISDAGNASAELYGTGMDFQFLQDPPQYNDRLNRIFIPYKCSKEVFKVTNCGSPFIHLEGEAMINRAAWALQTAAIDLAAPPAAAGTGAMIVECKEGLRLHWRGLKDLGLQQKGYAYLPQPMLLLEPGRICISDTKASGKNIRQFFNLWTHEINGDRSVANLGYNEQFPVFYNCYQKGEESVFCITNLQTAIDRPRKVNGYPFQVNSVNSLFILGSSKTEQIVYLLDNDLLNDNNPNKAGVPVFEGQALALENALMTVSPPTAFGLFGELLDDVHFEKAILTTSFGLLAYLPTLPDPYAANTGLLQRREHRYNKAKRPVYTSADFTNSLVAMIGWPTTPGDVNKQEPIVSFHFANPSNSTTQDAETIANFNDIRKLNTVTPQKPADPNKISITNNKILAGKLKSQVKTLNAYESKMADIRGREYPQIMDAFSLLDVSSNADLMGVSFGIQTDDFIFRRMHTVGPVLPAGNPIQIKGMKVEAPGKYVRAFTTPLVSWEPVLNITPPQTHDDPKVGLLLFPNDGGPSKIFNTSVEMVPIAPIPVTDFIIKNAREHPELPAWSIFTLPFGLRSLAVFYNSSEFYSHGNNKGAKLGFNNPDFPNDSRGGLQLRITSAEHPSRSSSFEGMTFQESNLVDETGTPTNKSILGFSVTTVFNNQFTTNGPIKPNGVPLERIDISGYGSSIFSNWLDENASFGETSQARFDVFRGRTAHEVIQIRSMIYPWAITVVRTITIYRTPSGFVYRHDSGWQAESDGIYDFSNNAHPEGNFNVIERVESPYTFHPGIVNGVYRVKNILENDLPPFSTTMHIAAGQKYVDPEKKEIKTAPASGLNFDVLMRPVYFDADAGIDFVTEGAVNGKVPSKKMLGYVQLKPQGQPITADAFRELLEFCNGSLGGPVDCLVNIGGSDQTMRISRVDVNASQDAGGKPVFASAVKGTVVLPKDGSWSIVQHNKATDEVSPVTNNNAVPLLKEGILSFDANRKQIFPSFDTGRFKIANPHDLVKNANDAAISYGFLQNTDTQKVLFKNPEFAKDIKKLLLNIQSVPKIADAYRLLNSPGIFPKLKDVLNLDLAAANFDIDISKEGYKLFDKTLSGKIFDKVIPDNISWHLINEEKLKIYIEYAAKDKNGSLKKEGSFKYDLDSAASTWLNKMNDVTIVVDLLGMTRILLIRGKFDTEKGKAPSFLGPELEFGKDLQPIVEILQLLEMISMEADYADIMKKGLKIVMSNSPENWEYKFQADKEIPVVRFPPPKLDSPTAPLRLEAGLKVGCYFNMAVPIPPTSGITTPSAGAFIEFAAKLSVMCLTVGAATIYAVGAANLRLSADSKRGPVLDMKFSFAVELMVGLPVIGNVSVTYGAGVIIQISNDKVAVGALIFFKGRAEILGGIVTVTIYIEASGKIERTISDGETEETTKCIAQVTFALDISICFIIDISFEKHWQETRKIA